MVPIHRGTGWRWRRSLAGMGGSVAEGGCRGRRQFLVEGGWPGVHQLLFSSPPAKEGNNVKSTGIMYNI